MEMNADQHIAPGNIIGNGSTAFAYAALPRIPVYYEKRNVDTCRNNHVFDQWAGRHFCGLSEQQKTKLKNEYRRAQSLNVSERVIYLRAFDISEHYRSNLQGAGIKAQLIVASKTEALRYQGFLAELGQVKSEIIISAPGVSEGAFPGDEDLNNGVAYYWKRKQELSVSEHEYNKAVMNRFRHGIVPEILIVVDEILSGLEVPRNSVIYLARNMPLHTLSTELPHDSQMFVSKTSCASGYRLIIDYANNALNAAQPVPSTDTGMESGACAQTGDIRDIKNILELLPYYYEQLCQVFKLNECWLDIHTCALILEDTIARASFYSRLEMFSRTLKLALATDDFVMRTSRRQQKQYISDLGWCNDLYASVISRYEDSVDERSGEPGVHGSGGHDGSCANINVQQTGVSTCANVSALINEDHVPYRSTLALSDANAVVHVLVNLIPDQPAGKVILTDRHRQQVQRLVVDFNAGRITEFEYLEKASCIRDSIANLVHEDAPEMIYNNPLALACYVQIKLVLETFGLQKSVIAELTANTSLALTNIVRQNWKVRFWDDIDAQHQVMNKIDDYLYDELSKANKIAFTPDQLDSIINIIFQQAREHLKQ